MSEINLVQIVEGALLAAGKTLSVAQLGELFEEHERPDAAAIREVLADIAERCDGRGFELQEVASGFRFQVRQNLSPWVARLWHERPQKYSRALLETLALIAYRQPITRGEIEEIRGVAVSSNIIKTLHEREWVRVVGHRDVPGRPAMYATTRQFLDYFNLKNLDQLPALAEIRDLETLNAELGFADPLTPAAANDGEAATESASGSEGDTGQGEVAAEAQGSMFDTESAAEVAPEGVLEAGPAGSPVVSDETAVVDDEVDVAGDSDVEAVLDEQPEPDVATRQVDPQ